MAVLSITIPDAQIPRVKDALVLFNEIESDATNGEAATALTNILVERIKELVRRAEKRVASDAARDAVTDINVT